uniref:Transcription factor CBF/NF-Y/archaeal histone domain-containing protein n=1 Tax=Oryza barthii TaxID=65489 RepID=A0A0D3GZR7_9ORYZ
MDPMDIVGKSKEDVSLPKLARDAQDLLVECCVEFINLLSSESNEVCSREDKKTIAPEHVLRALQDLGFREYIEEVQAAYEHHKHDTLDSPKASKFTGVEMTEEQAVAEQQRMSQNLKRSSKHNSYHSLSCTLNHSNPCSLNFSSIHNHNNSPHSCFLSNSCCILNRSKLRSLNFRSTLNHSSPHSCNRNLSSTSNHSCPHNCSRNLSSPHNRSSPHSCSLNFSSILNHNNSPHSCSRNLSSISNRSCSRSRRQSCNHSHNRKQNMAWTGPIRSQISLGLNPSTLAIQSPLPPSLSSLELEESGAVPATSGLSFLSHATAALGRTGHCA